jgi:serine/threonine protein kinase
VLGAVGYMAPEQIAGRRADQTADLYAIGVIAHELLSGKRFIEPASVHDMMRAGLRPKLERLSALRRDVPDGLEAVIERALAPEPVDRYASAREMLSAIAAVVPRERMTGKTRALVTTLFKDETEAKRARVREILGRDGSATADTGSDTSLEIFAGGVRFPMYDASQSLDTDSGDATAVAPVEDAHPIHATLRLSLEQDRGQTVLIPTIDRVDSTSQARVITRVTRVPVRPKRRWVGAAMFLVIGILLGIGSRVLLD